MFRQPDLSVSSEPVGLGGHLLTHEFLYLPDCPVLLLGRDLLIKLGSQITFTPRKLVSLTLRNRETVMMAVTVPQENE